MSRKFLVLSALALGLIVPASAKTYTRDEAVQTAIENSPDVKTAEEDLIKASSQVDAGYGNAYPSIDLSANVTRIFGLDDVKKTSAITDAAKNMANSVDDDGHPKANAFDQNVIGPALDGMTYGMKSQAYRWQSSVGLTLTQVLYAAGKVGTAIDIAKAYKHMEEVNLEDKKSSIRYDVDSLFNNLILLDSSIAITEEGIKQTEENLNIATQKFQSGSGKEIDVIRAQLDLETQRSDLEKTKKLRILAKNALLNKMGLDWDSEVQFVGELRMPEANLPYPDTAMANVKKRRRELAKLEATEKMREKNIEIEEAGSSQHTTHERNCRTRIPPANRGVRQQLGRRAQSNRNFKTSGRLGKSRIRNLRSSLPNRPGNANQPSRRKPKASLGQAWLHEGCS